MFLISKPALHLRRNMECIQDTKGKLKREKQRKKYQMLVLDDIGSWHLGHFSF